MRKQKATLKYLRPLARQLAEQANTFDRASRSLHRLAEKIHEAECDANALTAFMVTTDKKEPRSEWPCDLHDKHTITCPSCHAIWLRIRNTEGITAL